MRQRAIRARSSRTPARPQTSAITTNAARAGPRSDGKLVGQPIPCFTTSPAATNGNVHAHETAYAKATKTASGQNLIVSPRIRRVTAGLRPGRRARPTRVAVAPQSVLY